MTRNLLLISILCLAVSVKLHAQKGEWRFNSQAGVSVQNQTVDFDGLSLHYRYGIQGMIEATHPLSTSSFFTVSAAFYMSEASKDQSSLREVRHNSRMTQAPLLAGIRYNRPVSNKMNLFIQPQGGFAFTAIKYRVKTNPQFVMVTAVDGTDMHVIPVFNLNTGIDYALSEKLKIILDGRVQRAFWDQLTYSYDASFRSSWLSGQSSYKTSSSKLNLLLALKLGYTF